MSAEAPLIAALEARLHRALLAGHDSNAGEIHRGLLELIENTRGSDARKIASENVRAHVRQQLADVVGLLRAEQYERALHMTRYVASYARATGHRDLLCASLTHAGYAHIRRGEIDLAQAALEYGRRVANTTGEQGAQAAVEANLAEVRFLRSDLGAAQAHYTRALVLSRAAGDCAVEASAVNGLAIIARHRGRLGEARAGYVQALELARAASDIPSQRAALVNLGFLEQLRAGHAAAQALYREALSVAETGGDAHGVRVATAVLAGSLLLTGDIETAEPLLVRQLADARSVGDQFAERSALHQLAHVVRTQGDATRGWALMETARLIARKIGDRRGQLQSDSLAGWWELEEGRVGHARSTFDRVVASAQADTDPRILWEALDGLGRCDIDEGALESALAKLRMAFKLVSNVAGSAATAEEQAEVFARGAVLAARFADLSHRVISGNSRGGAIVGNHNALFWDAFTAVEDSRARDLRSALAEPERLAVLGIQPPAVEQLAALATTVRSLEAEASPKVADQLATARSMLRDRRNALSAEYPSYKAATEPPVPTFDGIQGSLRQDQVIWAYTLTGDVGMCFVFTASGRGSVMLDDPQGTSTMARALASAAASPVGRSLPFANELFKRLVVPALRLCDALKADPSEVFVVPDGVLHQIPFSLLLTRPGMTQADQAIDDFSTLSYLDERFAVRTVPSVDMAVRLAGQESHRATYDQAACLIGDPVRADGAPQLPGTAGELDAIREAIVGTSSGHVSWRSADIAAHTRTGARCTKRAVLDLLGAGTSYQYLHIAAHAIVEAVPGRSGVLLSPDGDGDPIWRVHEMLGVKLSTRLAVISACDTGSGRFVAGSGVSSIAKALLISGARSVVGSLWRVADRETAILMAAFYERLAIGATPTEALRRASQALRDDPEMRPYHWAGFVTTG
jgi:CHAT domain-containing protein/Flp pilus assembly protein TadD